MCFMLFFWLIWMFPKIVVPQNGWFRMENPIKMDDLVGFPIFLETPILRFQLLHFNHATKTTTKDGFWGESWRMTTLWSRQRPRPQRWWRENGTGSMYGFQVENGNTMHVVKSAPSATTASTLGFLEPDGAGDVELSVEIRNLGIKLDS